MAPRWQVPAEFEDEWPGSSARATEVVLNLIRTADTMTTLIASLATRFGLPSTSALIVLNILRGERGPLQPSVIADRSFLSRPAMSSVLTTLQHHGLVERTPHPDDRRKSLVAITTTGLDALEHLLPVLHRAEAQFIDPALTHTEQEHLLGELERLQSHLEHIPAEDVRN